MILSRLGAGLAVTFVLTVPLVAGPVVYTYTGNDFTTLIGSPPLTTSDFISGSFTLASPLAANLVDANEMAAALSFTITDQVNTLSLGGPGPLALLNIWTDSAGNITQWEFDADVCAATTSVPCLSIGTINDPAVEVADFSALYSVGATSQIWDAVGANPGTWAEASTPEPSTAVMVFLGWTILLLTMKRRYRSSSVRRTALCRKVA